MYVPAPSCVPSYYAHLRNLEHVPNTNALYIAELTGAKTVTQRSVWFTALLGPDIRFDKGVRFFVPGAYVIRGGVTEVKIGNRRGMWKVFAHSPSTIDDTNQWCYRHMGEIFTDDGASAQRMLRVLAREMCLDHP
jgi:hypothetical protein